MLSVLDDARTALLEPDPARKCAAATALYRSLGSYTDGLPETPAASPSTPSRVTEPGRPQRPSLVHPRELPRRRPGTIRGRAALIHAVAHIEFNAINLALDAVCRFPQMPGAFVRDWLQVAAEEAKHFTLLQGRLEALGFGYGDFPAHNGLWEMALRTGHDPLHRMALVPRVMEARGLDVTPGMIRRFTDLGDQETAAVLGIILEEEVGHVAAGTRWFHYLCKQRGLEAEQAYFELLQAYLGDDIRCPLHLEARREAGFTDKELERLKALCVDS